MSRGGRLSGSRVANILVQRSAGLNFSLEAGRLPWAFIDSATVPSNSVIPEPFFRSAGIFPQMDASLRLSTVFSNANDSPHFLRCP